jgi:GGDEF domain-containing protein
VRATGTALSPFRKEGLLRRSAPFLVAMLISYAAIRLPAVERDGGRLASAALLNVLMIVIVLVLPWQRLPRTADLLPPLLYMVVVALMRDGLGGAVSAYSTLLILPVFWIAMYGTRAQLAVGVIGVALLLTMPVLMIGEPEYTAEEWRRALLWVTVSGIIGLAVQDLVEQVRQRADALHTVSAAVGRRTREIETRSAICEAAKDNARAQYAFLLEPDANARRLVTTAATDPAVESTEFFINDTKAAAARAYTTAREQTQQDVEQSPLLAANGTITQAGTILWHPVPGHESPLGVLGVAWSHPVKRLPETLPAVMEALAAEAAGVIERTTLLLRLETVVKVDDVTGLPNERAWEEEVPRELSRARREGTPLSVVLLDLGDFELSPEGSVGRREAELLRSAANRWRGELAPREFLAHRDPPGRFAALLANSGAEDAEDTALRLQALAPDGRGCAIAVATWNGIELPAALVGRAETQIELERAAARAD